MLMTKAFLTVALLWFVLTVDNVEGGYGKGHVTYKGFSGHAGFHHKGYGYGHGHVTYKGFSGHAGHHKGGGGYGHGGYGHDHGGHSPGGGYVDHFDHH